MRKLTNDNLTALWHNRLVYISRRRIERLVLEKNLNPINFKDFDIYVSCIKGKQFNKRRFADNKTLDVLELTYGYLWIILYGYLQCAIIFYDVYRLFFLIWLYISTPLKITVVGCIQKF